MMTTMIGGAVIPDPIATKTVALAAPATSTAASNRMTTAEVLLAVGTTMTTTGASGADPRTTMTGVRPVDEAGTETPKDTARPRGNVGKRVDHPGRAVAMTMTTGADPAAGMMMMTTMIAADPAAVPMTMTAPGGVDAAGMAIPRDIRRLHANGEKNGDHPGRVVVPTRMTMIVAVDPALVKMKATAGGSATREAMRRLRAEGGRNGPRDHLEAAAGMTTMIAEAPAHAMTKITAAGSAIHADMQKQRVAAGKIATDSCGMRLLASGDGLFPEASGSIALS